MISVGTRMIINQIPFDEQCNEYYETNANTSTQTETPYNPEHRIICTIAIVITFIFCSLSSRNIGINSVIPHSRIN